MSVFLFISSKIYLTKLAYSIGVAVAEEVER